MKPVSKKQIILILLLLFLSILIFSKGKTIKAEEQESTLSCGDPMPAGKIIDDTEKFSKALSEYLDEIETEANNQYNSAQAQAMAVSSQGQADFLPILPDQCWNGFEPEEYRCKSGYWARYALCCVSVIYRDGIPVGCSCYSLACVSCGCKCFYRNYDYDELQTDFDEMQEDYMDNLDNAISDISNKCQDSECTREEKIYSPACNTNICPSQAEDPDIPGNTINCSGAASIELCDKCERALCQRESRIDFSLTVASGTTTITTIIKICPRIEDPDNPGQFINCEQELNNNDNEIADIASTASDLLADFINIHSYSSPCPPLIWEKIEIIKNGYNSVKNSFSKIQENYDYLEDLIKATDIYPDKNKIYRQEIIDKMGVSTSTPGIRSSLSKCVITKSEYSELIEEKTPVEEPISCHLLIKLIKYGTLVKIDGENICDESILTEPFLTPDNIYLNYYCCKYEFY
ncbi:hypothetical protein KAS79_02995 [Candidatus Parcubacteria bacterium]|nr:hypothetical protein [Candidatus Parcubacteria bacterium]